MDIKTKLENLAEEQWVELIVILARKMYAEDMRYLKNINDEFDSEKDYGVQDPMRHVIYFVNALLHVSPDRRSSYIDKKFFFKH